MTAPPPTLPARARQSAAAPAPAAPPSAGAPPPEEALRWTVGEVCSFVREIGLAQHEPVASAFQRHGVSGALLLSLTRAELGELLGDATAIADRRQLAAKIADLRWASSRRQRRRAARAAPAVAGLAQIARFCRGAPSRGQRDGDVLYFALTRSAERHSRMPCGFASTSDK